MKLRIWSVLLWIFLWLGLVLIARGAEPEGNLLLRQVYIHNGGRIVIEEWSYIPPPPPAIYYRPAPMYASLPSYSAPVRSVPVRALPIIPGIIAQTAVRHNTQYAIGTATGPILTSAPVVQPRGGIRLNAGISLGYCPD